MNKSNLSRVTRQAVSFDVITAPAKSPEVTPIPDGCGDIARMLSLPPEKTMWDYNGVFSDASGMKFTDPTLGVVHQGITSLVRGGANGVTLALPPGMLEYQQEYVGVGRVVQVTNKLPEGNHFLFPQQEVSTQMVAAAAENARLREFFNDKVHCPLMCASEIALNAGKVGATTLTTPEEGYFFNSKVRIVEQAATAGYNVSPHVVAKSWEDLPGKMDELAGMAKDLGLDPYKTKYWVKFDNLAGGMGVMPFEPEKKNFGEVTQWLKDGVRDAGLPAGSFIPVVMDIDIGALPNVSRVLDNLNVQAVIGPAGVKVTGTTQQQTKNGKYIGGILPMTPEELERAAEARRWALPVLESAQKQGYRGYAGIDVILCEGKDGKPVGYVLEMNGRLNSSTSLLSMSHYVARESGAPTVAANLSGEFSPVETFGQYARAVDSVLYKGRSSLYEGIVPIILKPDENGRIYGAKTIAVARNPARLANLEQRYTKALQRVGLT